MSYFDEAVGAVLREEGGYVNDPNDDGGETKYGISRKAYPEIDIASLTESDAKAIYKRDYWDRFHLDDLEYDGSFNKEMVIKVFSIIVNMGGNPAIKCLQRACRACGRYTKDDGVFGSGTLTAVRLSDQQSLLAALKSEAAGHYRYLVSIKPQNRGFLDGWLSRAYR